MGGSETDASPAKASKTGAATTTSASQEQTSTASTPMAYPDWTGFQAFSPVPPHGFFHSPVVSSPTPHHPYMWGPQQFMPPYGTPPPPYLAMYPHGGLYGHPSIPPGSHPLSPYAMPSPNSNAEGVDIDGKLSEGKGKSSMKRSKGSLGSLNMLTGKTNELGKTSGPSGNGFISQSGDSASEGSSEGSDANSQNDIQEKNGGGQDSLGAAASKNENAMHGSQNGANQTMPNMSIATPGGPGSAAGPTTNLNIGIDYWGGSAASPMPLLRGKVPGPPAVGSIAPAGLAGPREPSEHWLQDERELKRQRRKQSNRESARRSRLRKQAECEELAHRVEVLKEENVALKSEASRMRNEYEQLVVENTSLKERLGEIPRGHDDPRFEAHNKHPGHGNHNGNLESDKQTGETDI